MELVLEINPEMTSDENPWVTQWLLNKSLSSLPEDSFSTFYTPVPSNQNSFRQPSSYRMLSLPSTSSYSSIHPSSSNFPDVICLETKRRVGWQGTEEVDTKKSDADIEYLDVKQTDEESNNFPPNNLSFDYISPCDDKSRSDDVEESDPTLYNCKSNRPFSCWTYRVSLFLLLFSIFTLLIFGYFIPSFNIYGLFPSIHSSYRGDHYGDVDGLNPSERWWKEGIFYEIFPASFKDSNSDGFGDLNGIREKLSYLKSDLGVTGIRLNSIFKALDYPFQYDHVVDFKSIDPHIGSLQDFVHLVEEAHEYGLALILDINPVMTSDQHPWATQWLLNKSLSSLPGDFSNFYTPNPRNNKPLDVTSSTAIDRESVRDLEEMHISFGGHLYLNWSSQGVQENMMEVFNFWLNLGVDGFYLKNLHLMQVNSPETILNIIHNLKHLLISRSSHSDRGRSSASLYLSSSSPNVMREKRDISKNKEGVLKEEMLKNVSVEIEEGFDGRLEGDSYISQSNHSSFLEENFDKDAGDMDEKNRKKEGGSEMKDEWQRSKKVVKRRSGEEKQNRRGGGQEGERKEMPSRILMASKYSLDLLSDQIRKHFELKYFSSLRIPFPKHTLHSSKLRPENEKEEKVKGGEIEKKENGMKKKREMFDGKQKERANVRLEYDLNSFFKEQRKGEGKEETRRRKDQKVRRKREKRNEVSEQRNSTSSNQAEKDEDVSTHNNILQAIPGRIDDHQGIHLEFYGNKNSMSKELHSKSVEREEDERVKSATKYAAQEKEKLNERVEGNGPNKDANDDDDSNILDQVLMRQSLNEMQSDDGSLGTKSNTMKSNDRNKNNNILTETSAHKSIYSYFDLVDIYLDIQLNQTENIRDQINSVYINEPATHPWVNWNIGSSLTSRLATRLGSNLTLTSMFLLFMFPGSITIFSGDELGLKNSVNQLSHKEYRGGQLVPMSWSTSPFGNFTNNKTTSSLDGHSIPWIPMNSDCTTNNVQLKYGSSIKSLSSLISFRKTYFKHEGNNNFINNNNNLNEKRGNYLFHYIHDGELVLERYFSRKKSSSSSFTSFKKRKRRSRWNANHHRHHNEDGEGWGEEWEERRQKREVKSTNNIYKRRTNSNIFPSTSQEICSNNSSSKCSLRNGSQTTKNFHNNNYSSLATRKGTIGRLTDNDKDNYKLHPRNYSLPSSPSPNSSASLTEQESFHPPSLSVLKDKHSKIQKEEGSKLIVKENESFSNKNGNENRDIMKQIIAKSKDTSASVFVSSTSTSFSNEEEERTGEKNEMVIGPRKNEMIRKENVRQQKVEQMMMTKTTRIGEEQETSKEADKAVTMSKRNDMKKEIENEKGRKFVAEVEKKSGKIRIAAGEGGMVDKSEERLDRQVIWDRKDEMKEGDDSNDQKVVTSNYNISMLDDLETHQSDELNIKGEGIVSIERNKQQQGVGSTNNGDELVIGSMVELPKVAQQETDDYQDDQDSEREKDEDIEQELIGHVDENSEEIEGDEGQRSTIAESSLSPVLFPSSIGSSISSPLSSNTDDDGETVVRSRFVLFANLASSTVRIKDLRDKFHSGSIKVTSNPRRMRDFLYFRSLKLDPGEALIAQVE